MKEILSDIKYFWPSIKPYKWYYLVMFSATLISAFQMPASYYGIKLVVDILTTKQDFTYTELIYPIIIFLAAQLLHEFGWRMSNIAEWKSEPYVKKDIILKTYDYIQNHSYVFFQENFVGSLTSKIKDISSGYKAIREAIHYGFIHKLILVVVATTALFLIQPSIGAFILFWSMLICILTYFLSTKTLHLSTDLMRSKHKMMGLIADKLSNVLSLILFSARNREKEKLSKHIDKKVVPKDIKLAKYEMITHLTQGILYVVMIFITLFILIRYRKAGLITIGDFAFVVGIVFYLTEMIWYMMVNFQTFSAAIGDLHSAMDIINTNHDLKDSPNAKRLKTSKDSVCIEFKNIYFSYKTTKVFQSFNLKIKPGEKIAIVGYSGGGKSTLISLLLKYFHLQKGDILIDNISTNNITSDSLRRHISVIPQDIMLFHDTLLENIRYSRPNATDKDVMEAAKKAYIHEHIITLPDKYNTFVGERGVKISVGQRQRIAIARAILKDAPILILDEATSSLDSKTERYIQQSIDDILTHSHRTIIAIAHRLSTIKHMDRIIVISNGKIAEEGKHSTLLKKKGIYADLWHHQKI